MNNNQIITIWILYRQMYTTCHELQNVLKHVTESWALWHLSECAWELAFVLVEEDRLPLSACSPPQKVDLCWLSWWCCLLSCEPTGNPNTLEGRKRYKLSWATSVSLWKVTIPYVGSLLHLWQYSLPSLLECDWHYPSLWFPYTHTFFS
jgi:hypothetical protein